MIGSCAIAGCGTNVSIVWTPTCNRCKPRRRSMDPRDRPSSAHAPVSDRELVFERIFEAPRELVFEAWSDPKHLAEWWGPNRFSTTTRGFHLEPDGVWRFVVHGPETDE